MSSPLSIQIKAEVDKADIHICRFTVDRPVMDGSAVFYTVEEAKDNDLAEKLLNIPGIMKVEINNNLVDVTQGGAEDWRQLGKRVGTAIRAFLNPLPEVPEGERVSSDIVRTKVQQVLDDMINPGVASHGGFVELLDVQGDNIFIRMGGGCQGCGAADVTLKMGIERLIREVTRAEEVTNTQS